jgi:hypothetical protein
LRSRILVLVNQHIPGLNFPLPLQPRRSYTRLILCLTEFCEGRGYSFLAVRRSFTGAAAPAEPAARATSRHFLIGGHMNVGAILLLVLIVALIGVVPAWPYSTGWGYYPSGGIGLVLLIVLVLVLLGRI